MRFLIFFVFAVMSMTGCASNQDWLQKRSVHIWIHKDYFSKDKATLTILTNPSIQWTGDNYFEWYSVFVNGVPIHRAASMTSIPFDCPYRAGDVIQVEGSIVAFGKFTARGVVPESAAIDKNYGLTSAKEFVNGNPIDIEKILGKNQTYFLLLVPKSNEDTNKQNSLEISVISGKTKIEMSDFIERETYDSRFNFNRSINSIVDDFKRNPEKFSIYLNLASENKIQNFDSGSNLQIQSANWIALTN